MPAMARAANNRYSSKMKMFDRITQEPGVMGGKACIRGMRVTAAMVVNQIGSGRSIDDVLQDYPYLERADVLQALQYAAWLAEGKDLALVEEA
jgi:uncharacterized protein (DUF433 family)